MTPTKNITDYAPLGRELMKYHSRRIPNQELAVVVDALARKAADGNQIDHRHHREAFYKYFSTLPKEDDDASKKVMRDAALELGISGVNSDYDSADVLRKKVAEDQQQISELEDRAADRFRRAAVLESEISNCREMISAWSQDWDEIERETEATITELWPANQLNLSPHDRSRVSAAFETLSRLPHLRRISVNAREALESKIKAATEELKSLRKK